MGIVNLTPDSFSGDGLDGDTAGAMRQAEEMVRAGADLLDLGGESTRPGARQVSTSEEMDRVIPVLERLAFCGVPISVDTRHAEVMRAAIAAGADMINDVQALSGPGALEAVCGSGAAVCLMHMQGQPESMQRSPRYDDVVADVAEFLRNRADRAIAGGVSSERIVVDPGFGFGKVLEHNLALLRGLRDIAGIGYPVLVGLSRKSMLGQLTGKPVGERTAASIAAALVGVARGASIVRVHDVAATRDALEIWNAV